MLIAAIAAVAIAAGSHPAVVAVGVLAVLRPGWFLVLAAGWAVRARLGRGRTPDIGAEVGFLHGLGAELRGGASLRSALAAAARRSPLRLEPTVRAAIAGLPIEDVAGRIEQALPESGRLTAAALRIATAVGGSSAGIFERLAAYAADRAEARRELEVLTAQARLSALIVGVAPLVLAVVMLAAGRGSVFLTGGEVGIIALAAGIGLMLSGLGLVLWMLRRSSP